MEFKKPNHPIKKLIFELSKLPSIGERTATRLAYFLLRQSNESINDLAAALFEVKNDITLCDQCFNYTPKESNPCFLCSDTRRDLSQICVVGIPSEVNSIEDSNFYHGGYHVLHGVLSPLDGIGPEELKIKELLHRLHENSISEVILALNPSVEGEATSLYIHKLIKPFGVKVTKLAYGLPAGGRLEYSDRMTISKAIDNRMEVHSL